jgi:hypothetical protein
MKKSDEKNIIYLIENDGYLKLKDVTLQNRFYMDENTKYYKLTDNKIRITTDEINKDCVLVSIID